MSHNKAEIIKAILTNTTLSEEKKSEIIAEIIEEFQKTYPDLQYHATKADIKEAELKITKEIENIKLEIEEILKLGQGSMLVLDTHMKDNLKLYINDEEIAKAKSVTIGDNLGAKITEISSTEKRLKDLTDLE